MVRYTIAVLNLIAAAAGFVLMVMSFQERAFGSAWINFGIIIINLLMAKVNFDG